MKIRTKTGIILAVIGIILLSAAGASEYETYLSEGTVFSLRERYAGQIEIGVPAEIILNADMDAVNLVTQQCSLLVCEETTNGDGLLDRGSSKKKKDQEHAKLKIGKAADALDFAMENGMKVRAGTVVRPGDTPEWFFNEDYSTLSDAQKMDRETMVRRMENAIRDQMELMNGQYPGIITEWETVCGTPYSDNDLYLEAIGNDYIALAFEFARKYAEEDQKLLWAMTGFPDTDTILQLLDLHAEGLVDGLVLKCSLTLAEEDLQKLEETIRFFSEEGLDIHLSDLEIAQTDRTASGRIRLAVRYKKIFSMAEQVGVKSISLAALQDAEGRDKKTPRFMDEKGRFIPAFFGALQDEVIPSEDTPEAIRAAVEQLDLETLIREEADPVVVYKTAEDHNPVMVQRFGADPWAMVYEDRVYLYMTGDDPAAEKGEKPKTNDYSNIVTLRVLSSDDLVNWEDHGSIRAAGGNGAARWASNSWAPCTAWKRIDGKDQFFLYFANSGGGIGVLTSDSPTGPFTDPLGKPLVSRATPTCANVAWLFDPAVLLDEDGNAYLYFGGGIPDGKQADPGTARVVKLGDDMISLDGDPVAINPPWLFEDSGINRFGDTYVYSYCSNFNVPVSGSKEGFGSGEIVYMTSDNPMGPYTYAGRVLRNPSSYFGVGGNNHHCMFEFRDQWYIAYHAATLDKAMGWNAGYRSTFIDRLELNTKGLPALSKGTTAGVPQVQAFDPYRTVPAATAVSMAGVTTELANISDRKAGTGPMAVISTSPDGWVAVAGVDFGFEGAASVRLLVRSEVPSGIKVFMDSIEGIPAAVLEIPAGEEDMEITAELAEHLTGTHNLFFLFTESETALLEWQFLQ